MRYKFVIILLTLSRIIAAQSFLPEYQYQYYDNDNRLAKIRWEPKTVEQWNASIKEGYHIQVFENRNTNNAIIDTLIKPRGISQWKKLPENIDSFFLQFYEGAANVLYVDEEMKQEAGKIIDSPNTSDIEKDVDEFRLYLLMYMATYDFKIAQQTGLAYEFVTNPNYDYQVKVWTEGFPVFNYIIEPKKKQIPTIPILQADFLNKEVELEWNTTEHTKDYFGYYLEVSKNGGLSYDYVDRLPFVNNNDSIISVINTRQELEKNYQSYVFRLRGINYIGVKSQRSSIVRGYGYEEIDRPPIITKAEQTEDNKAFLQWKTEPTLWRLMKELQVERADSLDGIFTPIGEKLSVTTQEIMLPLDSLSNYFRIVIIPKDGSPVHSNPVFIMGQDTVPPLTPADFTGEVDTSGVVKLSWTPNREKDLWGYKIFKSDFLNQEFTNITPDPIATYQYNDTIELMTNVDKVHYQIIALDKRNNSSKFSPILTLKRPDIIPPITPVFRNVEYIEDSTWVEVHWDNSGSDDLVEQQLFRKNLTANEINWSLVMTYDSTNLVRYYYDTDIIEDNEYAYLLVAKDDDGLSSEPSPPARTKVVNRKARNLFENIAVNVNEESGAATISWELADIENVEEIMVYRGKSEQEVSLYKIIDPIPNELVEENVKQGKPLYFYLNPIVKEGRPAKFSELIVVERNN